MTHIIKVPVEDIIKKSKRAESTPAAVFVLDITENYKNKNIVPDFLKELEEHNVRYEYEQPFLFEQVNAR